MVWSENAKKSNAMSRLNVELVKIDVSGKNFRRMATCRQTSEINGQATIKKIQASLSSKNENSGDDRNRSETRIEKTAETIKNRSFPSPKSQNLATVSENFNDWAEEDPYGLYDIPPFDLAERPRNSKRNSKTMLSAVNQFFSLRRNKKKEANRQAEIFSTSLVITSSSSESTELKAPADSMEGGFKRLLKRSMSLRLPRKRTNRSESNRSEFNQFDPNRSEFNQFDPNRRDVTANDHEIYGQISFHRHKSAQNFNLMSKSATLERIPVQLPQQPPQQQKRANFPISSTSQVLQVATRLREHPSPSLGAIRRAALGIRTSLPDKRTSRPISTASIDSNLSLNVER